MREKDTRAQIFSGDILFLWSDIQRRSVSRHIPGPERKSLVGPTFFRDTFPRRTAQGLDSLREPGEICHFGGVCRVACRRVFSMFQSCARGDPEGSVSGLTGLTCIWLATFGSKGFVLVAITKDADWFCGCCPCTLPITYALRLAPEVRNAPRVGSRRKFLNDRAKCTTRVGHINLLKPIVTSLRPTCWTGSACEEGPRE